MQVSRRSFLRKASYASAAVPLASVLGPLGRLYAARTAAPGYSDLNRWPGRSVVNYNTLASTGAAVDEVVVKRMVDDAIKLLTGGQTVGEAWKSLFPQLTESTKIAIKINILNAQLPPHPFVVMGITEGLVQMDAGGAAFPAANIHIYDANNGSDLGDAGFTAARFSAVNRVHHGGSPAYEDDWGDGARGEPYAPTLHDCDYLINVPGLRGHGAYAGKVTLGFKSHYGTYNPEFHDNSGTPPYLRDINCLGPVFEKTALVVNGAIFGMVQGHGPSGGADSYLAYAKTRDPALAQVEDFRSPNTVIMSTDPVTAEFQALKIMRMNQGEPFTIESMPSYLQASGGVDGALSDAVYNIGVIDEALMDTRHIVNGEIASIRRRGLYPGSVSPDGAIVNIVSRPSSPSTYITFMLPPGNAGRVVDIAITDGRGRIAAHLPWFAGGTVTTVAWDRTNRNGSPVAPGTYSVHINTGHRMLHSKFVIF